MRELDKLTLAEIVINDQRTAALFDKHRLDFSCNGKRTLAQACTESNIDTAILIGELKNLDNFSTVPENNYSKLSLTELIQHIVSKHHTFIKLEIPILSAYLKKITDAHKDEHPELLKITSLFNAFKEEMLMHLQKEELILFPRIKEIEKNCKDRTAKTKHSLTYLLAPIDIMKQEHDHADKLLIEIRKIANNYEWPADACTTYKLAFSAFDNFERDLHQHVHLENNILFPKAITLFKNCLEKI